jgi:hypothetical protein
LQPEPANPGVGNGRNDGPDMLKPASINAGSLQERFRGVGVPEITGGGQDGAASAISRPVFGLGRTQRFIARLIS